MCCLLRFALLLSVTTTIVLAEYKSSFSECSCLKTYDPVCGEDQVTYPNKCYAKCKKVEVASKSPCEPVEEDEACKDFKCPPVWSPICGKDGHTYRNYCIGVTCLKAEYAYEGEWPQSDVATALSRHNFTTKARPRGRSSGGGAQPKDESEEGAETQPVIDVTPSDPVSKDSPPQKPTSSGAEGKQAAKKRRSPKTEAEDVEDEAVSPWREDRAGDIRSLKASLLVEVAGYDRGFAAVAKDTAKIRSIVESLETLSGSIDLTGEGSTGISSQELFNGTWKLVFSSAFNAGGRRILPAPVLFSVGPVYQVVDTQNKELDNVLELLLSGAPRLPWTPSNAVPKVRLSLKHRMSYNMSIVSINFKETIARVLDAGFEIPKVKLPSLATTARNLTGRKSDGEFSLVYLDEDLRITEGDRSELRIFVKVSDLE